MARSRHGAVSHIGMILATMLGECLTEIGSYLGGAVSYDTGFVYPYFENTIYVKRTIGRNPDGTEGVAVAKVISPGNLLLTGEEMDRFRETGETPPGLRVLQINTDGIDPYEYLGLRR